LIIFGGGNGVKGSYSQIYFIYRRVSTGIAAQDWEYIKVV
jgi:hypothetical protein